MANITEHDEKLMNESTGEVIDPVFDLTQLLIVNC